MGRNKFGSFILIQLITETHFHVGNFAQILLHAGLFVLVQIRIAGRTSMNSGTLASSISALPHFYSSMVNDSGANGHYNGTRRLPTPLNISLGTH
jgi:hypothetical protein